MSYITPFFLTFQSLAEFFGDKDEISWSQILEYGGIALVGSVKFVIGVAMALAAQYTVLEVLLTATLGAFLGVWVFTYFGTQIRNWLDKRFKLGKKKTLHERPGLLKIWNRFGLTGIAFLAPIISPPISVGLAVSFREKPVRIIAYMGVSLLLWSIVFALFRDTLLAIFHVA